MTDAEFDKAAEDVRKLKGNPTNEELLKVYALFKQTKVGDVNTERPGLVHYKERSKWDAWSAIKGMPSSEAKKQYIAFVENLISTYGLKPF